MKHQFVFFKQQQGSSLTSLLDILFSAFGAVIVMTIIFSARIKNPEPTSFVEIMHKETTKSLPLEIKLEHTNKSGDKYKWLWFNGEFDKDLSDNLKHLKNDDKDLSSSKNDPLLSKGPDFTHLLLQDLSIGKYQLQVFLIEPPLFNTSYDNFKLTIRQSCQPQKEPLINKPSLETPLFEASFEVKELEELCKKNELSESGFSE